MKWPLRFGRTKEVYFLTDYETGTTTVHDSLIDAKEHYNADSAYKDVDWYEYITDRIWYANTVLARTPVASIERVSVLK